MRIAEAARHLGVSPDWLRRLEREGRVPEVIRDRNGCRRYTREDLDRLQDVLFNGKRTRQSQPTG